MGYKAKTDQDMMPDARYVIHTEMLRPHHHMNQVKRAEEDDREKAKAVEEILRRRGLGKWRRQ